MGLTLIGKGYLLSGERAKEKGAPPTRGGKKKRDELRFKEVVRNASERCIERRKKAPASCLGEAANAQQLTPGLPGIRKSFLVQKKSTTPLCPKSLFELKKKLSKKGP